ncbi:MAG TPA: hypothetical protein VKP64_12725 [Mycobacteriales bacterium]|nr:hypothetical protein [Mycobacteriales bacterium]
MFRTSPVQLAVLAALAAIPLTGTSTGAAGASPERPTASTAFPNPTRISNRWLPLVPGRQWILDGRADSGKGLKPHRVVMTVTDLTKVINGVRTVVVWDRDYSEGRLVESELAFNAQDGQGNVWNFGEYPEVYSRGKFKDAPDTWIPGVAGAKAGVAMLAAPRVGTPAYSQGWAPAIDFADRARVFQAGQRTCVPAGCFGNVLVTDEWDALDPSGGHQRKFYAAGVGNVRIGAVGGDKETLALVKSARLCPAVAQARAAALAMDQRGRRVSKVYRQTTPVQHTLRAPNC